MDNIVIEESLAAEAAMDSKSERVAELNEAEKSVSAATSETQEARDEDAAIKEDASAVPPQERLSVPEQRENSTVAKPKIKTGMVSVDRLRPYLRNAEIYQDREDALFTESIRKNGVLTTLVVTEDGEVLGGNQRLREARRVGLKEVPVTVVECGTEDEKMLRVLDDNLQRVKTKAEVIREYTERLKIEYREAARRKVEAGKKMVQEGEDVKTFTPAPGKKGKSRDNAAKGLNLSGVTAEKGRKTLEAVEKARSKDKPEIADELLLLLEKGFHTAYKRAKAYKLIAPDGGKVKKIEAAGKPSSQKQQTAGSKVVSSNAAPSAKSVSEHGIDAQKAPEQVITDVSIKGQTDEQPQVVRILSAFKKLVDELKSLELKELTDDEKGDIQRACNAVEDWNSDHAADLSLGE